MSNRTPLYHGKKVTLNEYENLKYDGFQYEIIEGVMKMVPAPYENHQSLISELHGRLYIFLKKNPIGIVRFAPRDVKLAENLIYQPDLLFISKDRLSINKKKYVDGPPDLIVEVLSKGTLIQDTRQKFNDYEKYGVKEYWIINPSDVETSEFYYLKDGKYEEIIPQDNIVKSKVIEGFEVNLSELENEK